MEERERGRDGQEIIGVPMSVKQEKDGSWRYDVWLGGRRGRRDRKKGFLTERAALDAVAILRADYRRQPSLFAAPTPTPTMKQVAENWTERQKRFRRTPEHIRIAERAFELFDAVFAFDQPVTELKTADLAEFIRQRELDVTRPTAFNDLIQVRAACRYAAGRMEGLETWKVPELPEGLERPKSRRDRVIERDEERKILEAMRDDRDAAELFTVAIDTAMRVGEIKAGLRWADVRTQASEFAPHGELIVRATKTGNRRTGETDNRTVPITKRVAELLEVRRLEHIWGEGSSDRVFAKDFDHHAALEKACKVAGLAYGRAAKNGIVFHDTRHTAITRMLQAGIDARTVMDIAGHKQIASTMHYGHSTAQSRYRALKALEDAAESER